MKNWASFILPSMLGLVAGISQSVTSHYQDHSFSFLEQVIESVREERFFD